MITVKVSSDKISLLGHANYDDFGKDIVCAAVSSIVITSVEGISLFDQEALNVTSNEEKTVIDIIKHSPVIDKLIINMLNCLQEIEYKYPKNIKIINREE